MDDHIVIGIDFGTTYSGVAWAYSQEPDNIEVVTTWDSELNQCSDLEKTPTQVYYSMEDKSIKWGYSIPPTVEPLRWFKLFLLEAKDLPADFLESPKFQKAARLRKSSKKQPIEIVADFMSCLWNHAQKAIAEAIGEDLLDQCRFHVVLTIPAIWPPYAHELMKEAAGRSGILKWRDCGKTTLELISEPEAAALASIKDLSKRSTVKAGDTVVVCDAGGGTVDLISYRICSKEPLSLKECVKGDGDLCGGVFLDDQFLKLVKTKIKNSWDTNVDLENKKRFINDNWEHGIKPQFRGQNRAWSVDLPEAVVQKGRGNKRSKCLELNTSEISQVFEPIMLKIEKLVKLQVLTITVDYGKEPKFVILVGGFGRSPYLLERIKKLVRGGTEVLQSRGSKPWAAICRGAAIHGITSLGLSRSLNIKVESRIARMSYGIVTQAPYDPDCHSTEDRYFCEVDQAWMADNQMEWFVTQGQELSAATRVRHTFYESYLGDIQEIDQTFYCSASAHPPSRREASVSRLCTVKWSRHIERDSLPLKFNSLGKPYRVLNFSIEMTCDGKSINFDVIYDGRSVANHNVVVDYE